MRAFHWVLTAIGGLGLGVLALTWAADDVAAQFPQNPAALERALEDGSLLALSTTLEGGTQQVTVIDAKSRSMAVYHISPGDGVITLKCVRNIQADLEIDDLNGATPRPAEVRALLQLQ